MVKEEYGEERSPRSELSERIRSPRKEQRQRSRTPGKVGSSPKRDGGSPKREEGSPKREEVSPKREEVIGKREEVSPTREGGVRARSREMRTSILPDQPWESGLLGQWTPRGQEDR